MGKAAVAQIPLGRVGPPDDIGPAAVFLASDAAKFITGDAITAYGRLDGVRWCDSQHLLGDEVTFVAGDSCYWHQPVAATTSRAMSLTRR